MKLGVLGGTFDPIHLGHLHIASRIQRLFGLSQIHFVVATTPPHKPAGRLLAFNHRYAMVALATSGFACFVPSMAELEPPASPFSVHTLSKLARRPGKNRASIYFIGGEDSLQDVANWRESKRLLTSYNFAFVSRRGVASLPVQSVLPKEARSRVRDLRGMSPRAVRRQVELEQRSLENRIFIVDLDALDISSTHIRHLASSGRKISHLVPRSVHEYIRKLHIYGA